jgi:replicative DNA helicase
VTTSMIASQIERNKPDIVIVDHITLMGRGAQDWQGVAQVADELTQLGNQYNIPIVSAAQLNRNGTSDSAGLESIAEADKIGQNASGVVFCRPKSRRVMKFENQKQRNGDGEFGYWAEFNPDIGVFREIDYDRAQELIEQDNEEAEENE